MKDSLSWRHDILPPAALTVALVAAWALVAWLSGLPDFILPSPSDVVRAIIDTRDALVPAMGVTLLETAIGLVFALMGGILAAALMDFSPLLKRALYPLLVVSQTIQVLAIAPILIIWFGFGLMPKVLIVVLFCFFPLAVSTADGLMSTDPDHIALLRSMGASRAQVWRMVRLPAALPSFFSGLRLAVTYSVVAATIGEWVGGSDGLGLYMLRSKNMLATDQVFAAMLITSALSIALFLLVTFLERRVIPWYFSANRQEQWEDAGIY